MSGALVIIIKIRYYNACRHKHLISSFYHHIHVHHLPSDIPIDKSRYSRGQYLCILERNHLYHQHTHQYQVLYSMVWVCMITSTWYHQRFRDCKPLILSYINNNIVKIEPALMEFQKTCGKLLIHNIASTVYTRLVWVQQLQLANCSNIWSDTVLSCYQHRKFNLTIVR